MEIKVLLPKFYKNVSKRFQHSKGKAKFFLTDKKIFFGQVHYGHLLVPKQIYLSLDKYQIFYFHSPKVK